MSRCSPLIPLLAVLAGCPGGPCAHEREIDLEIGGGTEQSGFLPLPDGADVAMWSVRHDWNRMVPLSLRAHGLHDRGVDEPFELSVGLYQDDVLVAGTSVADAVPTTAGDGSARFLGLLAQVVTYDYEPLSGLATTVEADIADGCGGVGSAAIDVVLWAPEDLCAADPPLSSAAVGGWDPSTGFVELAPLEQVEVVDLAGQGAGLLVSARATDGGSPLMGSYLLGSVLLRHEGDEVGRLEPELLGPTTWTRETADFLALPVPFDGAPPAAGERVEVTVVVDDACGRAVQAARVVVLR